MLLLSARSQIDWFVFVAGAGDVMVTVAPKCPGFVKWKFTKPGETLQDWKNKQHGVCEDMWLMCSEDMPDCLLRTEIMTSACPTFACVFYKHSFPSPVPWPLPSTQCTMYKVGMVEKAGTEQERQVFDLLISQARTFLMIRQRHKVRV